MLKEIARELTELVRRIGFNAIPEGSAGSIRSQCLFELSKYAILGRSYFLKNKTILGNRVALAYFHGDPVLTSNSARFLIA